MHYLSRVNWPFVLACFAVALALACFAHQYLELDYLSASVVGLFGWVGVVIASVDDGDEPQVNT